MIRRSKLAGSSLLVAGTIAAVCAAAGAAAGSGEDASQVDALLAKAKPAASVPAPMRVRGLVCTRISPVLASQLEVDPEAALVVQNVDPGSPADAAGLEEYDVILLISGQPADAATLEAAVVEGGHVELGILRGGDPQVALLPDGTPSASEFVAADALGPDHPIVRLRELNRLQDSLEQESEDVSERRREVAEAQRAARDEARAAAEALHAECVDEAQAFFDARREALYAAVDEAFAAERVVPLAALRMDLGASLPAEGVRALDEALHDLAHEIEDGLVERVSLNEAPSARSIAHVASVISSHMHDRVQEPWGDVAERHERHAEDLGPRHDERMTWVAEMLERTRGELHERIDCAVDRSVERFSKRLGGRLSSMDVPRSAEIEASLDDVADQLDAWTVGFVREATHALTTYAEQVGPARTALAADLGTRMNAAKAGHAALVEKIEAAVSEPFVPPADVELAASDWRRSDAARTYVSTLRASLEDAVNEGRDALRPEAIAIIRSLRDEQERSDEAWADLRDVMKRLRSRASDDCWKLDGPHMDGRFQKKLRGEVAMTD